MKLFRKNEVLFAVILILVYVFGSILMQSVSEMLGVEFLAETVFDLLLAAVLFFWIRHNGLMPYLGLRKPEVSAAKMLFYVPLLLIGGVAACFGVGMEYIPLISVLHTVMMLCVGFLEEVIFRGFLFRGIARKSLTRGIVISSLTFGIGHFVNLFTGDDLFGNLIQVIYAVAMGFLLVFLFLRTGSILPCIAFHAFNNCMTAFATGAYLMDRFGEKTAILICVSIQLLLAAGYLLYVLRLPKRALPEHDAPAA